MINKQHTKTLFQIFILFSLLVTACGPATSDEKPPENKLIVMDWSGYEYETYWEPFRADNPDTNVEYSFFAEDAEAFAKAQGGFQFDIIHACSSWWQLYVDAGLVQPIDVSKLDNWGGVYDRLAKEGNKNGQQYFIPWDWGYESILVRTDLVDEMPTSWADLWDPQYAGHVALYDSGESNFVMTALVLGIDPYTATEKEAAQIQQKLVDLKPNLLTYWADYTEINQLVAQGDVWLAANAWNDAYATLAGEGVAVDYINPEEGRLGWVCGYGISANPGNLDLSYQFLNALLDPQSQANMGNDYAYGVSNSEATALLDPEFVSLMNLGDPSVLDSTFFYQALTEAQRELFVNTWNAVKAGE